MSSDKSEYNKKDEISNGLNYVMVGLGAFCVSAGGVLLADEIMIEDALDKALYRSLEVVNPGNLTEAYKIANENFTNIPAYGLGIVSITAGAILLASGLYGFGKNLIKEYKSDLNKKE
ncbi:MAG: hypothetical protein NT129_01170 [Candidatus Aenigmarchaeota archaeon]|nr:hypothetical protein [Candidatus Aenigmarchaeota archaeon]